MTMPSLEYLSSEVQGEREAYVRHLEGLDAKAGVLLGFSGVLVALATGAGTVFGALAGGAALIAAIFAFSAYAPRTYAVLDLAHIRERYVDAEERFTRLLLLDTKIELIHELAAALQEKAIRLKVGFILLTVSGGPLLSGHVATIAREVAA